MRSKYQTPLNVKQLTYFLALAEHGTISAAANALDMAQPSLSENIAKLEKLLDVQLVIRGARGVQMTQAGAALARRGEAILRDINNLVEEVRSLTGEARGPVSVGLPPSLSCLLSVPLLETIHSEYPTIDVHIAEAMSGDIIDWIASDRVDLGCVYECSDGVSNIYEPILTEELFLVTAPDNWPDPIGADGFALEPISATQLQELPLVLTSPGHGARKLQEKFARSIGIKLEVAAAIDSLPHIVEMVSRASAYSILSHGAVVNQVASGSLALVPIAEPTIRRTAYLVRKRTRPMSRACEIVEARILTILREIVARYGIRAVLPPPADVASKEPERIAN